MIHPIDLQFRGLPNAITAYLVVGPDGPVLIETGPSTTLENLRRGLAEHGYAPEEVRHVLVTHIHLDHAGAAGWFARHGAQIYVHRVGAPHLIDPAKLIQSAGRIYGDMMNELWGEILPVPAAQVTPLDDRDRVKAGGLEFIALDTPGHARHHHAFRLEDAVFSGDAAGIHVPGSAMISLPTPPPEFELETWHATIDRMARESFSVIFPTHCCPIEEPKAHLQELDGLLYDSAEFVRKQVEAGAGREEVLEAYTAWDRQRAAASRVPPDILAKFDSVNPLFMSVDGLIRYWRKQAQG